MAAPVLDRLLETCVHRRATDLLLLPHSPPQLRVADSWRSLAIPPVTAADIASLCQQIFTDPPTTSPDGYASSELRYGNGTQFRAMAFGYPETTALVLTPHAAQ